MFGKTIKRNKKTSSQKISSRKDLLKKNFAKKNAFKTPLNKAKPLINILWSYITILLIPLISILFIYQTSISVVTNSSKREFNNMLNQVKNITDTKLTELETISNTLQTSELITSLSNVEKYRDDNARYYAIYTIAQNLPNLKNSNFLIDEYYIITKNSDYAISSKVAVKYNDRFINYFLKDNPSATGFEQLIFGASYEYDYITTAANELLFVHTIYDTVTSKVLATLVIKLDEMFFNNMLNQLDSTEAAFFILNQPTLENPNPIPVSYYQSSTLNLEYDKILPQVYSRDILHNKDYITASTVSKYNNWTYYAISPKSIVLSAVTPVSSVIISLFIVSLILGVIAAYVISRNKYGILKRLVSFVSPNNVDNNNDDINDFDIYHSLEYGINSLIDKNNNLVKTVDKQKPLFEAAVLRKLLYADYTSVLEISDIVNLYPNGNKTKFITILVYYSQASKSDKLSLSVSSTIVKTTLSNVFANPLHILDVSNNSFVCLISGVNGQSLYPDLDFYGGAINSLKIARDVLLLESDIRTSFIVSEVYEEITSTHIAFEAIQYIDLNACKIDEQFIYTYEDILHISPVLFYYPIDVELELVQLVKYGNSLELKKLLSNIYEENFVKRNLTSLMAKQLVFAMRCTIIRNLKDLVDDPSITELINNIHSSNSIDQIFNNTIRINLMICNIVKDKEEQKTTAFKGDIINYISDNYLDSNLSIKTLCKHFFIGESAMYQFFRDNMECSCSELIEKTRIHNACELLKTKQFAISQVALQCGYTSDDSFRRAFKRVLGIVPTEYLKSC